MKERWGGSRSGSWHSLHSRRVHSKHSSRTMSDSSIPSLSRARNEKRHAAVQRDLQEIGQRLSSLEEAMVGVHSKLDALVDAVTTVSLHAPPGLHISTLPASREQALHEGTFHDQVLLRLDLLEKLYVFTDFDNLQRAADLIVSSLHDTEEEYTVACKLQTNMARTILEISGNDDKDAILHSNQALEISPGYTQLRDSSDLALKELPPIMSNHGVDPACNTLYFDIFDDKVDVEVQTMPPELDTHASLDDAPSIDPNESRLPSGGLPVPRPSGPTLGDFQRAETAKETQFALPACVNDFHTQPIDWEVFELIGT